MLGAAKGSDEDLGSGEYGGGGQQRHVQPVDAVKMAESNVGRAAWEVNGSTEVRKRESNFP